MRQFVTLILTLTACFGLQAIALRAVGGRTAKSESNYFSSLGRIQAGAKGDVRMMLLGSSITGRLPDKTNGFSGVANMGCDGGSAVDALRAMDRGLLPVAPVLVIESNTLHRALDPIPSEVGAAMGKPWFQAGLRVPAISAYARPAGFAYSALLARKIGGFGPAEGGPDLGVQTRPSLWTAPLENGIQGPEEKLIPEIVNIIRKLRARGCRTLFVWLPPGRADEVPPPSWVLRLAQESGSEWWDLGSDLEKGVIELTDGVHMSAASAARTVRTLKKGILGDQP